jgi:methyl-accepting chemotaxis protein
MEKENIPTIRIRVVGAKNIRNFFIVFTVLGIVSIILVRSINIDSLAFQMAIPAFVVVFYAFFIFAKGKNVIHTEQLADSVYYLGFILTLFALIFALYDMSKDLTAGIIIPKFGIALVTTVVGIGIRVYVTQFVPTQEDVSEITEKQLTDTASNLKTHLDVSIKTFRDFIDETSRKTSETLEKNTLELISFLKENLDEFAKASSNIIENINKSSTALVNKSTHLEKALEDLNSSTENFNSNLQSISSKANSLGNSLENLNSALSKNNPSQELANLQNVIRAVQHSMKSSAEELTKIKNIVSTDLQEISKNKKEVYKSIDDSQAALQKMYSNMASMSDLIVSKLKRK